MDCVRGPPSGSFHLALEGVGSECVGSDSAPRSQAYMKPNRPAVESYRLYAAVVIDDGGRLSFRTSHCLKRDRENLLREAGERLADEWKATQQQKAPTQYGSAVAQKGFKRSGSPGSAAPSTVQSQQMVRHSSLPRQKRPRVGDRSTLAGAAGDSLSHSNQHIIVSREQNSKLAANRLGKLPCPVPVPRIMTMQLQINDPQQVMVWMGTAFAAAQQLACRSLAKEWVKLIQPKKQSTNPYNGKRPDFDEPSPERTKPPYWPTHVKHREPDHLYIHERIDLLVHLVMNTPQREITPAHPSGQGGKLIWSSDLLHVLDWEKMGAISENREIIESIMKVRERMEGHQTSCIDDETWITVKAYLKKPRNKSTATHDELPPEDSKDTVELKDAIWGYTATAATASPPASVSSFDSTAPQSEAGGQDYPTHLTTSFTSDATNDSCFSVPSSCSQLLPRQQAGSYQDTSLDTGANMLVTNVEMSGDGPQYSQHHYNLHRQASVHSDWTTATALDAQITGSFAEQGFLNMVPDAAQFHIEPGIDPCAAGLHSVLPVTALQNPQAYSGYYTSCMGRDASGRLTQDMHGIPLHMSHIIQTANRDFAGPVDYYAHGYEQQHRHLRR